MTISLTLYLRNCSLALKILIIYIFTASFLFIFLVEFLPSAFLFILSLSNFVFSLNCGWIIYGFKALCNFCILYMVPALKIINRSFSENYPMRKILYTLIFIEGEKRDICIKMREHIEQKSSYKGN